MDETSLRLTLDNIKIKIGSDASAIVSSPEHNTLKLKELINLLNRSVIHGFKAEEHNHTVLALHQLIATTLTEIFKDIIPSYRIRQDNADENDRQKKHTINLRNYERTLYNHYDTFLKYLERMVESVKKKPTSTFYQEVVKADNKDKIQLANIALTCFGGLLHEHPHFNLRDKLIKHLVDFSAKSKYPECSRVASESLGKVLRDDKLGEVSLEVVRLTSDIVKTRKLSMAPAIFQCLIELKLIDVRLADEDIKAKKKAERQKQALMNIKQSRKDKKRAKKEKKLKSEMKETLAETTVDQKLKYHRFVLKKLFVIYFRLLKFHEELDGERMETRKFVKLLPPVLEGIGKFAHLTDTAICQDIFPFIGRLLQNSHIPTNCMLHSLSVVFVLYKSLESELGSIDPGSFYKHFYSILTYLKPYNLSEEEFRSLLNCIDLIVVKRAKHISNCRYAAFIKRILTISLSLPAEHVVDLLTALRQVFLQRASSIALLDPSNCSNYGSGEYLMDVDDPDQSYSDASVCWELNLLKNHYDPTVRDYANFFVNDLLQVN